MKHNHSDIGFRSVTADERRFAGMLGRRGLHNIIIDPNQQNFRAVRAYRKAGFAAIPWLEGRTGCALIMQFDPNQPGKV